MTTLAITPNWKNKTAKFKGTVAAGEHVAVTIANDDGTGSAFVPAEALATLRLNVLDPATGRLLATFPEPVEEDADDEETSGDSGAESTSVPDAWDTDPTPLACTLNLNTVQMLKAVRCGIRQFLFVLDDYDAKTLYFKDLCEVEVWPRRFGEEEPVDLDGYQDFVADMEAAWATYKAQIDADLAAQDASINALDESKADASDLADHVGNTSNPHSVTKGQLGLGNVDNTSDADKPVSTATAAAIAAAKAYVAGLVDSEATARAAADSALDAAKAAKATTLSGYGITDAKIENGVITLGGSTLTPAPAATTYTKSEVDAIVAAVKTGSRQIVDSLDDVTDPQPLVIYMVAKSSAQTSNVYDEYIWIVVDDVGRWEKIGDTEIDLSGYVPTSRKVAGKALTSDVTLGPSDVGAAASSDAVLNNRYSAWSCSPAKIGSRWLGVNFDGSQNKWVLIYLDDSSTAGNEPAGTTTSTSLEFEVSILGGTTTVAATRTELVGYVLGSQFDKPLQSLLTAAQLAKIAAVSSATAFDAAKVGGYEAGEAVVYEGVLYTFNAAHTGAWTGTDADAVDVVALINALAASKAADNAVVKLTGDQTISGVKTFSEHLNIDVDDGGTGYAQILEVLINTIGGFAITYRGGKFHIYANGNTYDFPVDYGTFALLESIASDWMTTTEIGTVFSENQLASFGGKLYSCVLGYAFNGEDVPSIDTTHWTPATVEDVLAALRSAMAGKADVSAVPYSLGTPTVIDTASSETVEGETVYYGEATLADRTANIVQVTAATALDELRITFPAATSGKVRDFGLRVEIGTGSAALAAPALVPVAPTGETIKIENNASEIPALADGTATAKGVTLLYFSENATGVFVVKGEQVEEVA